MSGLQSKAFCTWRRIEYNEENLPKMEPARFVCPEADLEGWHMRLKLALLFIVSSVLCSCCGIDRYIGIGSTRSPNSTDVTDNGVGQCIGDVSAVKYEYWTGPISSPWSEEYIISETSVRLTRSGNQGDNVNVGTWEFATDPERVALLFDQLKAVDWSAIVAIPPQESLDGGSSLLYEVTCERGSVASLWYRPGWTYTGGKAVMESIETFISDLSLPSGASPAFSGDPGGQEKEKTGP
jgi:hypothetical protein